MLGAFLLVSALVLKPAFGQPPLASKSKSQSNSTLTIYELVEEDLISPQWMDKDTYETSREKQLSDQTYVRYPHPEQRYRTTSTNQELILLSSEHRQLFPSAEKVLQLKKAPYKVMTYFDVRPIFARSTNARHRIAEALELRRRNFGSSDEVLVPFLFLPTGWPFFLVVMFVMAVFIVPILGAFLVHAGFKVAFFYTTFVWGPVKFLLRSWVVRMEVHNYRWRRFLAPPYFLEPRTTWKMPSLLRNDEYEDLPPEVAYKPPINKIDYTMYILAQEDYDEYDLDVDELEYVDEMLQFRDENPKQVARLLKFKLGEEKFYHYFDEDILSSDEDEEAEEEEVKTEAAEADDKQESDDDMELAGQVEDLLNAVESDEAWMHNEYDKTFRGTPAELEEIQKRRDILVELREELKYLHGLLQASGKYTVNMTSVPVDKRRKMQTQTKKLMERYYKYSTRTKERMVELEPSKKIQNVHNVALSKYLPLISKLSHYNHRLNLKHEKQKEVEKRVVQLDIFGGP